MSHRNAPGQQSRSSIAAQARQIAERIQRLPYDVVASFAAADAQERVSQLKSSTGGILIGMMPVVGWVERRRHPETAELLKRRLALVINEAVACAAYDIPEYTGGTTRGTGRPPSDGAQRTATLVVTANAVADSLRGWADDIEAEDMQRQHGSEEDPVEPTTKDQQPDTSARVFSRLLVAARQVCFGFSGEYEMGLMGLRYTGDDVVDLMGESEDGAAKLPGECEDAPQVYAPGFLRESKKAWPGLESKYLGDISFGPLPAGGCTVVAMFEPGDMAKRLLGQFKEFSKLGGSHLPDNILQSHELWPHGPVDRWLTFLWRVGVLDKVNDTVCLTSNAFDASARAIERCGLHTDSPRLPDLPAPPHTTQANGSDLAIGVNKGSDQGPGDEKERMGFPTPRTSHSKDFASVRWYGIDYTFTKLQAACVKVLWTAWENKTPILSEETILEQAGSEGNRLRDVFKAAKGIHPAWGTMIVAAGKGRFQLQEPKKR